MAKITISNLGRGAGRDPEHDLASTSELAHRGSLVTQRFDPMVVALYRSMQRMYADSLGHFPSHVGTVIAHGQHGVVAHAAYRGTARFRAFVAAGLALMGLALAVLVFHNLQLEQRVTREEVRVSDVSKHYASRSAELEQQLARGHARMSTIAETLARAERNMLSRTELATLKVALEENLSVATQRLEDLESRSAATKRVIASATQSVVFLLGSYGYVDKESGRPLRYVIGPDGDPLTTPQGSAVFTLDGDGPVVEAHFTGTGFIATRDGRLLTNRHVALPWENNDATSSLVARGLVPVMLRFAGYLSGSEDSFPVKLVRVSDDSDVALLDGGSALAGRPFLELSAEPPQPGEEVIVMGYPMGIRALLARAEDRFRKELQEEGGLDLWVAAERLARQAGITPLATRGIVSQTAAAAVVYDAETAPGGSGGPVLGIDGKVVGINSAILVDFDGSNLGVPVERILPVLEGERG